jgi:23S rRNA pseudouridine955/2504/2580 synthase
MKEIVVSKNEAGKRLDGFLNSYLKEASQGFIYKMLRKKNITLNDRKADGKEKLSEGDSIKIFFSDETFEKFRGGANTRLKEQLPQISAGFGEFPVIYEDENIILADKPKGMLSQKASPGDISLNEWLIEYLLKKGDITAESLDTFRPSICNRLDRNTSGLVICGKTLVGSQVMNELIRDRRVRKFYRTVVKGKVAGELTIKGYLSKNVKTNKVFIEDKPLDESYSYIETRYRQITYYPDDNATLLEVELITGKPHQIRAHLSSTGHPVIGDIKYGGPGIKGLNSQLLHSYRLVFPKDMEKPFENIAGREFTAPCPAEFNLFR